MMDIASCGAPFDAHGLFVVYASPFFYAAMFAGLLLLIALNRKSLVKSFSGVDKKYYVALVLIFVLAVWLRAPRLSQSDEMMASSWEYVQGAKFLASGGSLYRCEYGSFNNCLCPTLVSHPAGLSFLLAVTFFFGANATYIPYLQLLVGSLAIVGVFFLSYILTKDERVSLVSSFCMAVLPLAVYYSIVAEGLESVFSVLFTALYFTFFVHSLRERTKPAYALAAISYATLLAFRMEYLIYLPFSGLIYLQFRGFGKGAIGKLKTWLWANRASLLISMTLAAAPLSIFVRFWILGGYAYSSFSSAYVLTGLQRFASSADTFLIPWIFLFTLCAPLLLASKKRRKLSVALYAWFLMMIAFFAFFIHGPAGRYLMSISIPLAIVVGLGTKEIAGRLGKAGLFVMVAIPVTLLIFSQTMPSWYNDVVTIEDALLAMKAAPTGSMFVVPSIDNVWAIQSFDSAETALPFFHLHRMQGAQEFYFLRIDRCDFSMHEEYRDMCSYLESIGKLVSQSGGAKLYKVTPSEEQFGRLLELREKYKAFF